MRDIKFRAWHKKKGLMFVVSMLSWLVGGLRVEDPATISEFQGDDMMLMQYTGLKDKNGVEIYEDDVVKKSKYADPMYVEYDIEVTGFMLREANENFNCFPDIGDMAELEVIGNIHANPELVKS